MLAAFDVHYLPDGQATAAAVLFGRYSDPEPESEYRCHIDAVSPYEPGQFYKRELPCIIEILRYFPTLPAEMLVDGYASLGDRPGLGRRLFELFGGRIPVIGIAKSPFKGASALEVFRGGSRRPLYVTSAGIDNEAASARIGAMHGDFRLPTLLRRVDGLARTTITPGSTS